MKVENYKNIKNQFLIKRMENEYKHDLIDYIVDLPMTMSIQGILKDYNEAYDIEIEVSYFF